MMIGRK